MFDLTGKLLPDVSFSARGQVRVTFELNEKLSALNMFNELHEAEKLCIKVGKFREKRSLNANNFAWKLMTEIGNRTRQSKEDVYFLMLKRYGQSEMISVLAHIQIGQFVKYCEEAGESTLNGKLFKHYRVYKGSSEFDTKEMSIFIDGVVSEAKDLGIETLPPERLSAPCRFW